MHFAPVVLYYYHCIIFTNISGNLRVYLSRIPYQILNKWIDIYRRILGKLYIHGKLNNEKLPNGLSSRITNFQKLNGAKDP